ncbi:MAG: MFS transporter [Euryarchaeota archaeon]|nr:MFS transporter [Euryarchaeota archaeon]
MEERKKFFYGLSLAGALAILSSTMSKNPVLPMLSKSLGADAGLIGGLVIAASTIPGILVSLPAGSLSDIFGRKKVMYVSAFVFASAPFLYLLISNPWELIAVRFYHGFATALFATVANAAIIDNFPDEKASRMSFYSSATIVGRGLAPFLGGAILLLTNSNYNDVYWVVGFAGVSALFAIVMVYHSGRDIAKKSIKKGSTIRHQLRSIVTNRRVLVASSVEAAQYLTFGAFEAFIVFYALDRDISTFFITLITGSQLLTVIFAKPILGKMSDEYGRNQFIVAGTLIGGIVLLAVPFTEDPLVLIVISILYGIGYSAVTSSTVALVSDLCTESASGSTMGFLNTVMDIGQAVGPIATGALVGTALGYTGGFWFMGIVLLAASMVFSIVFVHRQDCMPMEMKS